MHEYRGLTAILRRIGLRFPENLDGKGRLKTGSVLVSETTGKALDTVDLSNSETALALAVVDASGTQVTTFRNTEYQEGDAVPAGTEDAPGLVWSEGGTMRFVSSAKPLPVTATLSSAVVDTELTTADLDTGGGTDTRAVVGLVGSKSGGGEVIPGSATDGLLVNLGSNNDVTFPTGVLDSFAHVVTGSINNQVDVQFYRDADPANLVTVTEANGGTATTTGGMATFATTTAASSQAKGVSTTSTVYTAGAEVYCIFTAAFTGTGSGTSYHRIGLYDGTNGFYIGYEAGTFGFSVITGGSPTQTAKGSWNVDALTGAAGSKFTRAGVPEAVVLTNLNVWRIRFGWVGSAPIKLEVLSPDGEWVLCHVVRQPNNAAVPSVAEADLQVTCDVNAGNSGAALSILTNCWGAGTTQALYPIDATITADTLASQTRAVIVGETTAGGGAFVNVKVNPSGALSVAADTELPAAAALTDNFANPTAPGVGSFGMLWDGATWDRAPGTSTDGVLVNLGGNNDVTVTSGSVTADTELPTAAALADGAGNPTTPTVGAAGLMWNGLSWDRVRGSAAAGLTVNTELPAAASPTDNYATPSAPAVAAFNMVYDGATWDMARGDSTDGTLVNLGANNDVTLNAGTAAVGKLLPPDVDVTTHSNYARKYYTNAGAVTDGIVWSPASGKRWHVVTMYLQVSAAATVTLEDDKAAGDDPVWKGELAANSGVVLQFSEKYPMASGEDAADLLVTTSAGNVYITVVGYEV